MTPGRPLMSPVSAQSIDLASWLGLALGPGHFFLRLGYNSRENWTSLIFSGVAPLCSNKIAASATVEKPFGGTNRRYHSAFWALNLHPANMRPECPVFQPGTLPQSN
jgi:hypothetical protein